jgi:creatinine amidohydrolase/Fe(II)-dependent formamide hydrolase-like protein
MKKPAAHASIAGRLGVGPGRGACSLRADMFALAMAAIVMTFLATTAATAGAAEPSASAAPSVSAGPSPRGNPCARNVYNCPDTPNPLPAAKTIWLEEMTWMDVRDALSAGKKTIIIPTGGVEPNGPWVALGKHDYVLRATCEATARNLGNALCAPIIPFVPEGDLEAKTGHMSSVGTISVRQETYEALVTDITRSMKAHGFENIILISDNGGSNQGGMKSVAERLNAEWGRTLVYYIPEYYQSWEGADAILLKKGVTNAGVRDGLHDDPSVTTLMMLTDPNMVRWSERVKAGKATIDGVPLTDKKQVLAWGHELLDYRAGVTAEAITKAIAAAHATPPAGARADPSAGVPADASIGVRPVAQ